MSYRDCFITSTAGLAGPAGPAGASITAAALAPNGDLILQLSDGTTINAGPIPYEFGNEPWRIAGPAGAGGALAQPTSADDVNAPDAVQHLGPTLVGGQVGDTPAAQLHILGDGSAFWSQIVENDAVIAQTLYISNLGSPGQNAARAGHRVSRADGGVGATDQFIIAFDPSPGGTSFKIDRKRNFSNSAYFLEEPGMQGVFVMRDGQIGTWNENIPPTTPNFANGYMWVKRIAGFGEWFVMDGAGNVTQLSSHPLIADTLFAAIDEDHADLLGHYQFSYNIISGVGQIATAHGRRIVFDIDSGHYILYAADGVQLDQGDHPQLAAFGAQHPLPEGCPRGPDYLAHVQASAGGERSTEHSRSPNQTVEPTPALQRQFALRDKLGAGRRKRKTRKGG